MRILFLSQVLPYPLDAGPKTRSYLVLRHLAQKHEITLLTFIRDSDRPQHIAHLRQFCRQVHTVPMQRSRLQDLKFLAQSIVTGDPFLILRDHVPAMTDMLHRLTNSEQYDVIHADQLWMAQYALAAKRLSPTSRVILDQHNAVHMIPRRMADDERHPLKRKFLAGEAHRLANYEADVCQRFDQVVWVTEEDRQAVTTLFASSANSRQDAPVIPICVDPSSIKPVSNDYRYRVTFLGGLHWPPNAQGVLWFAKQVFPRVRAEIPEAVFTVIGKRPPAGLDGEGIEVTGYVVDPMPYLSETAAFIVPLHAGGGMRVKILDAWSWGVPVVSTAIGAEGIEAVHKKNMLIADNAVAFSQAVIRIFKEPNLAQQLRENGRQTVLEKYNWQITYADWDHVYKTDDNNGVTEEEEGNNAISI